ncbi:hypothetical protein TIFTF001_002513 [Ficus carica]|uniref:Uncharacterized protein n=1 Tax=Ficus carica TaxID=3494 RepID=A0AA87ZB86_FICCA|nr:hypothetical protein TIFTF001_002513 [Ficus carica]
MEGKVADESQWVATTFDHHAWWLGEATSQGIKYIRFENPEHRGWTKKEDQRPKQYMGKRKEHNSRRNCEAANGQGLRGQSTEPL